MELISAHIVLCYLAPGIFLKIISKLKWVGEVITAKKEISHARKGNQNNYLPLKFRI